MDTFLSNAEIFWSDVAYLAHPMSAVISITDINIKMDLCFKRIAPLLSLILIYYSHEKATPK